jgi:hypothetical protein
VRGIRRRIFNFRGIGRLRKDVRKIVVRGVVFYLGYDNFRYMHESKLVLNFYKNFDILNEEKLCHLGCLINVGHHYDY